MEIKREVRGRPLFYVDGGDAETAVFGAVLSRDGKMAVIRTGSHFITIAPSKSPVYTPHSLPRIVTPCDMGVVKVKEGEYAFYFCARMVIGLPFLALSGTGVPRGGRRVMSAHHLGMTEETASLVKAAPQAMPFWVTAVCHEESGSVRVEAWASSSKQLVGQPAIANDKLHVSLLVREAATDEIAHRVELDTHRTVSKVAIDASGNVLVAAPAGEDAHLYVVRGLKGQRAPVVTKLQVDGIVNFIAGVCFAGSHNSLFVGCRTGKIQVWTLETDGDKARLKGGKTLIQPFKGTKKQYQDSLKEARDGNFPITLFGLGTLPGGNKIIAGLCGVADAVFDVADVDNISAVALANPADSTFQPMIGSPSPGQLVCVFGGVGNASVAELSLDETFPRVARASVLAGSGPSFSQVGGRKFNERVAKRDIERAKAKGFASLWRVLPAKSTVYFHAGGRVSPDGRMVAVLCPNRCHFYDAPTGRLLNRVIGSTQHPFVDCAFSPDNKHLVLAHAMDVQVVSVEHALIIDTIVLSSETPGMSNVAQGIAFAPDSKTFAVGFMNKLVVCNLPTAETAATPKAYPIEQVGIIRRIAFSPDGSFVALVAKGSVMLVLDSNYEEIFCCQLQFRGANVAVSPDSSLIAASDDTGQLNVFRAADIMDGSNANVQQLFSMLLPDDVGTDGELANLRGLTFSPDGRYLALGYSDGTISMLDTTAGFAQVASCHDTQGGEFSLFAFHPEEPWFFVGYGMDLVCHAMNVEKALPETKWASAKRNRRALETIGKLASAPGLSASQLEGLLIKLDDLALGADTELKAQRKASVKGILGRLDAMRADLVFAQALQTADVSASFDLLSEAAELGHAEALLKLGVRFEEGHGVAKDAGKAFEMFSKAAEKGSVVGRFNLAVCFEVGAGVEKDEKKAVELYKAGVEDGDVNSMNNLGVCFEEGIGVDVDAARAVALYVQAGTNGDGDAKFNLAECYENGVGVEKDLGKALELYREAAAAGNSDAEAKISQLA